MGVQIGAKPDAGFDDPLGMLKDCHRRIEHFLGIVCLVADRAQGRPLTEEEASAVQAALNYFRVGGVRHTADEEESLFPRLRSTGGEPEAVGGLQDDHRTADDLHTQVDVLYSEWLSDHVLGEEKQGELTTATEQLKELYSRHIEVEEQVVFPRAAQVLSPEAIQDMGREFQRRRAK